MTNKQSHLKVKTFLYKYLPDFEREGKSLVDTGEKKSLKQIRADLKNLRSEYKQKKSGMVENAREEFVEYFGPAIQITNTMENKNDITKEKRWQDFKFEDQSEGAYSYHFCIRTATPDDSRSGPLRLPGVQIEILSFFFRSTPSKGVIGSPVVTKALKSTDDNGYVIVEAPTEAFVKAKLETEGETINYDNDYFTQYARVVPSKFFFEVAGDIKPIITKEPKRTIDHLFAAGFETGIYPREGWFMLRQGNRINTEYVQTTIKGSNNKEQLGIKPNKTALVHVWSKQFIDFTPQKGVYTWGGRFGGLTLPVVYKDGWPEIYHLYHQLATDTDKLEKAIRKKSDELTTESQKNFAISRFNIELSEDNFMKIDVSDFVNNMTSTNQLNDGTPSWDITFRDGFLTDSHILKPSSGNLSSFDDEFFNRLAQYETVEDSADFGEATAVEHTSAIAREGTITHKRKTEEPGKVLLSDLIQGYNFISCYVYKGDIPFEMQSALTKFIASEDNLTLNELSEADLKYFGFRCLSNGFVTGTSVNRRPSAVDTVTAQGVGWTGLMKSTRTIYSPTLFTKSLYDSAEVLDGEQLTVFQSIYVDKSPLQIFYELFKKLYGIDILTKWYPHIDNNQQLTNLLSENYNFYLNEAEDSDKDRKFDPDAIEKHFGENPNAEYRSFFDQNRLKVRNVLQRGLFLIPPYLLSLVFKEQGYFVVDSEGNERGETTKENDLRLFDAECDMMTELGKLKDQLEKESLSASEINLKINEILRDYIRTIGVNTQTRKNTNPLQPVVFDPEILKLRAYFIFLRNGLSNFLPDLKTFSQIINEIKQNGYIEFFERFDGQVVIRPMKYNETYEIRDEKIVLDEESGEPSSYMLTSDSIGSIITRSYNKTIKGLVTKEKFEYQTDLLGSGIPFQHYFYSNGKLLLQYGLLESNATPNPNIRHILNDRENVEENRLTSVHQYARLVQELNNAALNRGSLTASGDVRIELGRTFFDTEEHKFGYIDSVTHSVTVGDTYQTSFSLNYVRNAHIKEELEEVIVNEHYSQVVDGEFRPIKTVEFRKLPELVNIANYFQEGLPGKSQGDTTPDNDKEEKQQVFDNFITITQKPGMGKKTTEFLKKTFAGQVVKGLAGDGFKDTWTNIRMGMKVKLGKEDEAIKYYNERAQD